MSIKLPSLNIWSTQQTYCSNIFAVNAIVMIRQSFNLLTGYGSPISLQINKIVELSTWIEFQKSVNLEYNTLVCWANGKNVSLIKRLMFQALSIFHKILENYLQKPFQFIFLFSYQITKMKIKSFECLKSIRNHAKKKLGTSNAWFTIHLSRRPIEPAYYILDWRISSQRGKSGFRKFFLTTQRLKENFGSISYQYFYW